LLALDSVLDLDPGLAIIDLFERAEPCVLGMNRPIGTCAR
jgi:hypothetical protein